MMVGGTAHPQFLIAGILAEKRVIMHEQKISSARRYDQRFPRRAFRTSGALLSLFLLRAGLGKEAFVTTWVVLAVMIDYRAWRYMVEMFPYRSGDDSSRGNGFHAYGAGRADWFFSSGPDRSVADLCGLVHQAARVWFVKLADEIQLRRL